MAYILVVDDSSFSRKAIIKIIESTGHEGLGAGDYEEFLEMMEKRSPHLVMLDLLMPGKSGYDILEYLKEKGSPVPVIVLTADIQTTVKEKCLALGAKEILHKPPLKEQIEEAINSVIKKSMKMR